MNFLIFSKKIGLPRGASAKWGFTLIELIVVMTISTIIMTALIIQQSKWNDSLAVNTQAYELALMIRQAQIYSLGVREDTFGAGDKFDVGYGVYIDEDLPGQYIFFADKNKDLKYDSGEAQETKTFTRGVTIYKFCGVGNPQSCSDSGALNQINISFFRPGSGASIRFLNNGGNTVNGINPPATIYLKSLKGQEASIKLEANGQVSVIQ